MTLTAARASSSDRELSPAPRQTWTARARPLVPIAAGVLVAAGLALRFWTKSALWLDEALTVNIAHLPLRRLPTALRHDGAPPLYYVLLHVWMRVFGTGDEAVRSLSGVVSVLTIPAVWWAARKLDRAAAAWPAVVVLALNPFAIRYATEARMYALVALEAALGIVAVAAALERPTLARLGAVSVVGASLLYTHYWGLYLLMATGFFLLVRVARPKTPEDRRTALRLVGALFGAGILWLPWVPTFLYQAKHTGTPWATPAAPAALINIMSELSGGIADGPRILGLLLSVLVLFALFARNVDHRYLEIDIRGRPVGRELFGVFLLAPSLALAAGLVSHSAFIGRYVSIVLPLLAVLVGLGVAAVPSHRARVAVLAAIALIGLGISFHAAQLKRTEAPVFAAYLHREAKPGDVVGYCPDQLGPDTNRVLGDALPQLSFPRIDGPKFVNWVDYAKASRDASPAAYAQALADRAGPGHTIWLVTSSAYRTAIRSCTQVQMRLSALRPNSRQVVPAKPGTYFEDAALVVFPAAGADQGAALPTPP